VVQGLGSRLEETESQVLLQGLVERESVHAELRCEAARLLGDSGLIPLIRPEYEGPDRFRCALVGWTLGDAAAKGVLSSALQEDDLPLDTAFLQRLGEELPADLNPLLEQSLEWADEAIVVTLAGAAARRDIQSAWLLLSRSLGSDDQLQGLEALDVVSALPSSPKVNDLLQAQRDRSTLAGAGAAMLLELRQGNEGLLETAAESDDRDLRLLSVEMSALALTNGATGKLERSCRDVLSVGLVDSDSAVRLAAVHALRIHADSDQWVALTGMLERADAVEQLDIASAIRCRMTALSRAGAETP
jgi:hypothetical protein